MDVYSELLPGFRHQRVATGATILHVATGGVGPPVLLLHGHPQTHLTWHKVAPTLVQAGYSVIAPDLRGYGDSDKPPGGDRHVAYSKREMAKDMAHLMTHLGHARFAVVGHDRGGRVAHRLALDHADRVRSMTVVDIAPTLTMYEQTTMEFARRYFWWFFLIQPAPLPEKMISADPAFFLDKHLKGQIKVEGASDPRVVAEYLRCYTAPGTIQAICEDYRAAASIDLDHDRADRERRISAPVQALWGALGTVGALYDVIATWREKADTVTGTALPCGHSPQEECPEAFLDQLLPFLRG